jgi:hypothetical protein
MSEGGEGVIFDFLRGRVWIFSGITHYIIIQYLTSEGGPKSANGGPYLLVEFDPLGSISTSRFGPGGPNLLVDMDDQGSKSKGVQINWDTGCRQIDFVEKQASK